MSYKPLIFNVPWSYFGVFRKWISTSGNLDVGNLRKKLDGIVFVTRERTVIVALNVQLLRNSMK
ncbi:hypothetical protein EHT87_06680 [Larkinella knui]|uniref:Uncharacterized protein n=1 Tax=Larkinella knui TaxID=2025310 RepID=A0A3P1CYK9_9BACT|nr:hypothetical protein EHT87_06680 [Larkinella knui]